MRRTAVVVFLTMLSVAAHAGFDEYKPASFESLLRGASPDTNVDHDLWPGTEGWIVKATFTGKTRTITDAHRSHITMWVKANGRSADQAALFASEVELREGKKNYWVPIQATLLEPLKEEVSSGGSASFFILHLGFCKTEPLFVVNEFEARSEP